MVAMFLAAFLSVLFTRLPEDIGAALRAAAAADPRVAEAVAGGRLAAGDLSDTSFIQRLPDLLAEPFEVGFSDSIDLVFLVAAGIVALGLVVLWFLPELPLRNQSGIQAARAEADASARPADDGSGQAVEAVGVTALTSTEPLVGRPGDAGSHRGLR